MASSVLEGYDYDAESRVLTVRFVTGRVYAYHDVPADVYEALVTSPSEGRYFNQEIRDRFPFQEL